MTNINPEAENRLISLAATWASKTDMEMGDTGSKVRQGMELALWIVQTGDDELGEVAGDIRAGRINLEQGPLLKLTDREKRFFCAIEEAEIGSEEDWLLQEELTGWVRTGKLPE